MTLFLGIDVGESGAMSLIDDKGKLVLVGDKLRCCRFGKASEPEMSQWIADALHDYRMDEIKAAIEKVRSSPQQGVTSAFTFGWNYGLVRGLLVAHQVAFEEPTPQVWQAALRIPPRNKKKESDSDFKRRLKEHAQQRWPRYTSQIVNENADSLLIAEWLRFHNRRL